DKVLTSVKVETININEGFTPAYHGGSIVCPLCHMILNVWFDPLRFKNDITAEVVRQLKGKN
ncbi:MAG: hypothetical protein ACREJN_04030, partial [Nitrospiraceae bacterium]